MGSENTSSTGSSDNARRSSRNRQYQQKIQKKEEQRTQMLNKDAYVKGSDESIVRSSSGSAIIAGKAGERAVEQSRQIELDRMYPTQESKTKAAIRDLEMRRRSTVPGILGVISRANIDSQISQLQSGGTAQFSRTTSGGFTTTGVTATTEGYDSTRNIAPISRGVTSQQATTSVAKASETEAPVVTTKTRTSSAARRALLGQSQTGVKARLFYKGK